MLFKIYRAAEKNPQIERDQADHLQVLWKTAPVKNPLERLLLIKATPNKKQATIYVQAGTYMNFEHQSAHY